MASAGVRRWRAAAAVAAAKKRVARHASKGGSTAQDLQVEREPSALADIGRHTLEISDVVEHGEGGVLRELRDAELDYM